VSDNYPEPQKAEKAVAAAEAAVGNAQAVVTDLEKKRAACGSSQVFRALKLGLARALTLVLRKSISCVPS
jgi:hypothetical protein